MSNFRDSQDDPDLDLGGVPDEEGISPADAADRVDADPVGQANRDDPVNGPVEAADDSVETGPDREESIELDKPEYDEA